MAKTKELRARPTFCVIKPTDPSKTQGGIIVPDATKQGWDIRTGEIISGHDDGGLSPSDIVMWAPGKGSEFMFKGEKFWMVKSDGVLCKIVDR